MTKVTANNGKENYVIAIQTPTGNSVLADEPKEKGGQDKGLSPKELLGAALAACTNATVRIYCERKEWDLTNVQVEIELIEQEDETIFKRKLKFEGNLDQAQRNRLLNVANACPIHKILTHTITVNTALL